MKRFVFAVAAALVLTFPTSSFAAEQSSHPLIFVSIDGYRADYIKRGLSPTLKTLIAGGVYANAMRPSFPSVTEPNHYTLLTGLRPDHHGVIDNSMIDPAIPGERFGEGAMFNDDPRWWAEATPLWVSAEKQGEIVAASGFPGTEALNHDTKPNYLQTWNPDLTPARQTEIVLGWLSLPTDVRPSMILLHYDPVDNMGHAHGPDSPELNGALRDVDAALAKLVSGLKARKLYDSTNIVIVSDHGMTATSADRVIYLDDLFDVSHAIVPSMGAYGGVDPLPGHEAEIAAALLTHHDHMTCWKKSEIPAALHYGTNSRVPAIFCLADDGWLVVTRAIAKAYGHPMLGNHGHDPADPNMAALFVAHGPSFRRGVTVPDFDNVDIYPLLAKLSNVTPLANDGDDSLIQAALKSP